MKLFKRNNDKSDDKTDVPPLEQFATKAVKSKSEISIQFIEAANVINALIASLEKRRSLSRRAAYDSVLERLTLQCSGCGATFGKQAILFLIMAEDSPFGAVGFGSSNASELLKGRCPNCKGTAAKATYNP